MEFQLEFQLEFKYEIKKKRWTCKIEIKKGKK